MANTTFSGPVRSENGFEQITKNATTGAITSNAAYDKGIRGGVQSLSGAVFTKVNILPIEIAGKVNTTPSVDDVKVLPESAFVTV